MLMTNIQMTVIETSCRDYLCLNCGNIIGRIVIQNHIEKLDMVPERGVMLTGDADIHCLFCGSVREWHPNDETLKRLVDRVLQMRKKRY